MTLKRIPSKERQPDRRPPVGPVQVTVTIRNPTDRNREWSGLFRVENGTTDSLVPGKHLDAIGLERIGRRRYEVADGSYLRLDIGVAEIEFMGEAVGGPVMFGDDHAEPLLGVTALESVGIEIDPVNQRLKRLPAVRLKGLNR